MTAPGASGTTALVDRQVAPGFVERIPISFARHHCVIALAGDDGQAIAALGDPSAHPAAVNMGRMLGVPVVPVAAPPAEILAAINAAYQRRTGQAATLVEGLDRAAVLGEVARFADAPRREDLLDTTGRAPVVKLVNLLLFEAAQARASDVHVQPLEDSLMVRLRIDGVLYDLFSLPKSLQDEIVSRVKVMARMDIAERRLAQDGRTTVQVGDHTVDLRIATLPTSFGERVVIRLLDKSARPYALDTLGMDAATLARFRRLISVDHGIVLVTGPTGSGKTTTLYSALQELNSRELNILTIEDPIEYRLERISQTQVSDKKGTTFESGLRSVLRQDPDIIMVGEIRDRETAVMAIQAALTGHLVFSTLHTNDSAGAVARLLDLGIEPYLLSSSVIGVLAQRLVRQVCPDCAAPHEPEPTLLARVGVRLDELEESAMRKGAGCARCRETGYRGRLGIFELLQVTEGVRAQIQARGTASEVRAAGLDSGMRTLRDDGLEKVSQGLTTLEEVARVALRAEGSA